MASYLIEHPQIGIRAEVEAPTPRSAKTSYLDYLRRNKMIPWRGSTSLRKGIIVDRIESGSQDVDVNLQYGSGFTPSSSGALVTPRVAESEPEPVPPPQRSVETPQRTPGLRSLYLRNTKIGVRSKKGRGL